MPQIFISKTIINQVRALPNYPNLKILDLSCGEAFIISELKQDGCEVTGTHYIENDYIINNSDLFDNLNIKSGVNLHKKIPFDDGEFDVILIIEVLEHLDSYNRVIQEASRVLKNRGYVIITTPNKYRLHSRLQFLMSGHHKLIQRRLSWDLEHDDLYSNHIHLVDFPLLNVLLYQGNIHIENVLNTKTKWRHFYTLPVFFINWVIHKLRIGYNQQKSELRNKGEANISYWMQTFNVCFSEQLAIVAMKKVS